MKTTHRIFHILNRNIAPQYKCSFDDIKNAFSKDYKDATEKDHFIHSRFFKECEDDDLESFIEFFDLSEEKIKEIYSQLPDRVFTGVSEVWDKYFNLKPLKEEKFPKKEISERVKKILKRKGIAIDEV